MEEQYQSISNIHQYPPITVSDMLLCSIKCLVKFKRIEYGIIKFDSCFRNDPFGDLADMVGIVFEEG
jgi:hypothetical protein